MLQNLFCRPPLMEVQPFYDTTESIWVAEIDGLEIYAKSLHEMQARLPEVHLIDYYPEGYHAKRPGFLEFSNRVPFIVTHRMSKAKQRQIDEYRALVRNAVPQPEPEAPAAKSKPQSSYEKVMNLAATGMRSPAIAEKLELTLATVQIHRMKAYKAKDPRAMPRPVRIVVRKGPNRTWTDDEDALLRSKAREGWSTIQIASLIGCSRNAIIGRGHRMGVHFHGKQHNQWMR